MEELEKKSLGIKSFLKAVVEKEGKQYDEDKTNLLIESYSNNYDSIVGDIGRKVGIPEDGIQEFKKLAFEKYKIQPTSTPEIPVQNKSQAEVEALKQKYGAPSVFRSKHIDKRIEERDLPNEQQPDIDYGPFDKELVEKNPQAKRNFERWQKEQANKVDYVNTRNDILKGQTQEEQAETISENVPIQTTIQEQESNMSGFGKELGQRAQRSGWNLNEMLVNTPDFINRVAVEALNLPVKGVGKLAEVSGLIETADNWRMVATDLRPENVNQYIEQQKGILTSEIAKINPKANMGIVESAQKGDWATFTRNLAGGVADSFAPSLAMMVSGGTMGVGGMIGSSTAVFGAGKYAEMNQQAPDMSEQAKVFAAATNGALEGIFETYLGSGAVGSAIKGVVTREGRDAAVKIVDKGIRQGFVDMLIKNPALAPLGEGFEEMGTQIAQNYVDKVSGFSPDINIMDGVVDAGLIGALSGAVHSAPLYAGKAILGSDKANPEGTTLTVDSAQAEEAKKIKRQEQIDQKITSVQDNEGNVTTTEIDGQKVYVKNAEDLGNPDATIFVRDEEGNTKPINAKKITTWNKQTPEEVKTDITNEDAFLEAEKLKQQEVTQKAADKGIEVGAEVENEFGTGTVTDISKDGVITAQDEAGQISTSTIDETAPVEEIQEPEPGEVNIDELSSEDAFLELSKTDPQTAAQILQDDINEARKTAAELRKIPGKRSEKLKRYKDASFIEAEADILENKYLKNEESTEQTGKVKQTGGNKTEKGKTNTKETQKQVKGEVLELPNLVNNSKNNPEKLTESVNNLGQEVEKVPKIGQQPIVSQSGTISQTGKSSQKVEPGVEGSEQKLLTSERKAGDSVKFIDYEDNEVTGTIESIFNDGKVASVRLDNGELENFPVSILESNNTPIEPVEQAKDTLTPEQKVQRINRLVDDAKHYDKLPKNHTNKIAAAGNDLQRLANSIGYSIGKNKKGETTVFDENKKPITRKIPIRQSQDEIQSHKALIDYPQEFQDFANFILEDIIRLNGVNLYFSGNKTASNTNTFQNAINHILNGNKTVAANKLLDDLKQIFDSGDITFTDGSGAPLNEFMAMFEREEEALWQTIENNNISKSELNELFLQYENESNERGIEGNGETDSQGDGQEPIDGDEGNVPEIEGREEVGETPVVQKNGKNENKEGDSPEKGLKAKLNEPNKNQEAPKPVEDKPADQFPEAGKKVEAKTILDNKVTGSQFKGETWRYFIDKISEYFLPTFNKPLVLTNTSDVIFDNFEKKYGQENIEQFISDVKANPKAVISIETSDKGRTFKTVIPEEAADYLLSKVTPTVKESLQVEKPVSEDKKEVVLPQKGDKIRFTRGGKERTFPFEEFKVMPDGTLHYDFFGQKTLKPGEYDIVKPFQTPLDKILDEAKEKKEQPREKIEDFGEKIEGARKDQIKKYFDKINLNGKILSTIFPKPDIKGLLESGLSVKDVAGIKVAYEFAVQDKKKGEKVMKFYAAYAKNILAESINLEYKNEGYVFTDFGKSQIELRTKAYQDVHNKLGADYLALDLTKVRIKEPDKSGRTTYYSNGEPIAASDVNYIVRYYVNTQKYFATLPEAIDYFTEQVKANTKIDEVVYKRKLNIYYDKRVKGEFYIGFPSKGDVIKLKDGFKTSREAFEALKNPEILADLQTMLERILSENRQKSKPAVRLKYSNETARERVGKDWRNGKNIGAKELAETFGFRAIEFGNWVNQKERQVFVNNTYDSLMDLAQLLNISPRSISLAGNLGLTFGSRGSGKAAAHYEPGRKIINLTKTQGLGSLAHEWWHGIDNYFADFKTAMNGMKSASAQEYSPEAREEIKKAFDELAKAVNNFTFKQRAQNLDGTRSVEYFSLPHEMSARAFENYTLNRLAQSGQVNDFIVNYISNEDWNGEANKYPYPIAEETETINEAFQQLFDTIQEKTDEEGNSVLFRMEDEETAEPFYSPTEKALERIKQEKGTPEQFKAMLLKNGAKEAEIDWMNWDDFARDKRVITKAEIQDWINENKVEVEEVTKGRTVNANDDGFVQSLLDGTDDKTTETKYSQYQEPGGENYKEVLLTMPVKGNTITIAEKEELEVLQRRMNNEIDFPQKDLDRFRVLMQKGRDSYDNKSQFKSSHFDEPNILAHIRFNERTDSEGNKVLFLEEIQSDWAQKGKKEGFKEGYKRENLRKGNDAFRTEQDKKLFHIIDHVNENGEVDQTFQILKSKYPTFEDAINYISTEKVKNTEAVPDMPFKQTPQWVSLALRRMVRYAAENGFDKIAWTTGEMQAERYDLSKQVDEVETIKSGDEYSVFVSKEGRKSGLGEFTADKLPDVVGKELAQKIVDSYPEGVGGRQNFKGLDLKVGGEGMKEFYDKIVPSTANKIFKRFGAKVETTEINTGNDINNETGEYINDNKTTVQSLSITPKMAQSAISEGMPLFQIIGESGAANLDKAEEATTRLDNLKVAREMETSGKPSIKLFEKSKPQDVKNKSFTPQQIKLATGWERGADGKWRYEVPDGNKYNDISTLKTKEYDGRTYKVDKLPALIDDPELFVAYPELKDVQVVLYNFNADGKNAEYRSASKIITDFPASITVWGVDYSKPQLSDSKKSSVLHEIQHAIQEIEGFATGGNEDYVRLKKLNPDNPLWNKWNSEENQKAIDEYAKLYDSQEYKTQFNESNKLFTEEYEPRIDELDRKFDSHEGDWKVLAREISSKKDEIFAEWDEMYKDKFPLLYKLDEIAKSNIIREPERKISNYDTYKRLAGEVEARNVQTRMNYTPEQRREKLLEETEDVSRKDQIFIYDSLGASMESGPEVKPDAKLTISDTAQASIKGKNNTINALNSLVGQFGVPITIIHSSELSEVVGLAAKRKKGTPVAFYHNGTAYIISDKIQSVSDTKQSYLHEAILHKGLDLLFNAGPVTVLGKKYNTKNELLDEVYSRLSPELISEISNKYTGGETSTKKQQREIAEEVLAKLNELEKTPSRLQVFMDSLWKFIKKLVGFSSKQFTMTDLHKMLADHRNQVKKLARGGISESSDPKLNSAIDFFNNPNFRFRSSNPEVNKVIDEFNARKNETPPSKPKGTGKNKSNETEKTIVTERTYKGEFSEAIRKKLEEIGLTRKVQTQKEAEQIGLDIIDEVGIEKALEAVRSGEVKGAPAGAIFHEKLKSIDSNMNAETDPKKYDRLAKEYADITEEMGSIATLYGQYNAFFNYIYQTSDLGFNAEKMINDYKEVNNGEISPELEAKFKQLEKDFREVQNKLAQEEQKVKELEEQASIDAIKASIQRQNKKKAKASDKIRETTDKLIELIDAGKLNRPGIFMAASPASLAWDLAMDTVKTAVKATGRTIEAIAKGFEAIKSTDWYKNLDANKKKQAKNAYYDYFTKADDKKDKDEKETPTYTLTKNGLKIPHSVIRGLVEQGIDNIEDLTQAVYDVIVDELPDITEREVRDAITGYGNIMNQNQEEIEREIRKMKDLGRAISGLEDISEGKRPQKSGLQRDKPDPDQRAIHKQVREAMKLLPVDEERKLNQQKTQLDAAKQRLINQIEDLQREIDRGELTPKNARTMQEDEELIQLRKDRDAKKAEHETLFNDEEFLNKKRVELSKKAVNRRIKELEKRIADGDFAPKVRKELIADNELIKLRAEKLRIQEEYKKEMYKAKLRNRTQSEKIKDGLWDAWNITRALRATGEFSFVGIQGLINTIAHPIQAKQAFRNAIRFFSSQRKADDWINNLKSQEWYPMLKESKLAITEPNAEMTAREELFYSGWTDMIWNSMGKMIGKNTDTWINSNPMRAIERAAVGYLDTQRVLRFLDGVEMLKEKGLEFNKENKQAYVEMADVINTFTGRASIGRLDPELLTKIFFSPRNWSSVIKSATPYAFYHFGKKRAGAEAWRPSVAQKMALADYSKFVGLTASIVSLIALALNGDDDDENKVELDPRSTDFGKIKIGNIRIDPWGGRIQQVVLISRLINGNVKNSYGEVVPIGTPYKSPTKAELILQMATNKLAPSASMIYKHLSAKVDKDGNKVDQWGEPYSLPSAIKENLYPIYWETLFELAEDDITALDGLLAVYSFFGGGVNIYDNTPEKITDRKLREQTILKSQFKEDLEAGYELTKEDSVKYNRSLLASRLKQQYVILNTRATRAEKEGNTKAAESLRQLIEDSKIKMSETDFSYEVMSPEVSRLSRVITPE